MSWKSCNVMLNSDSTGSLYAGDIVTGTVSFEFAKKKKIENIGFKIIGYCEAQWTRPRPTMPYIKIYSEKIKVLYIEMDVFRDTFGKVVEPGVYHFPFHFALPEDLPSTFESSIAKVYYSIKIQMKGTCKPRKKVAFTVLGNVNLNDIEEYLYPSTHIFQKTCWNSKSLSIRFRTYSGFASKQIVPFEVTIENEKQARIRKLNVYLIQKLRYSISEGYADEERKLCHVAHTKLQNLVHEVCNFIMQIPCLPPSTVYMTDPVIDISYVFRVEVVFLFHTNIHEDVPVTVATAPVIHNDFKRE